MYLHSMTSQNSKTILKTVFKSRMPLSRVSPFCERSSNSG